MNVFSDWEIANDSYPSLSYQQGFEQGMVEAQLILTGKSYQNGYTLVVYCVIRDRYMTAINVPRPTSWQLGYADGFDEAATVIQEVVN